MVSNENAPIIRHGSAHFVIALRVVFRKHLECMNEYDLVQLGEPFWWLAEARVGPGGQRTWGPFFTPSEYIVYDSALAKEGRF